MKMTLREPWMEPGLIRLWKVSFKDSEEYISRFLQACNQNGDCHVFLDKNTVAAALYVLPCAITLKEGIRPAGYIYAAATLPAYRGQGLMDALLKAAAAKAKKDGLCWLTLRPGEPHLFDYYGKRGYQPVFMADEVLCTREFLEQASVGRYTLAEYPPDKYDRIIEKALQSRHGSLLWGKNMVKYILAEHTSPGQPVLCVADGQNQAFALLREQEGDTLTIRETVADQKMFPALAGALLKESRAEKFKFRLPCGTLDASGEGMTKTTIPFAMAYPVNFPLVFGEGENAPFLPMCMD